MKIANTDACRKTSLGNPVNIKLMSSAYDSMYSPMTSLFDDEINNEIDIKLFHTLLMVVTNSINTIYNIRLNLIRL